MKDNTRFILINTATGGSLSGNDWLHVRPVPLHKIDHELKQLGFKSTVIEHFSFWEKSKLKQHILSMQDERIVLMFSFTLFNKRRNKIEIRDFVNYLKEDHNNVQVVAGGIKEYDAKNFLEFNFIDVIYTGRSINLLQKHCETGEIFTYLDQINKPRIFNIESQNVDEPITHYFYDDAVWSKNDVAVFEIGMGCKFNCTFCSYDLRNIKNPTLQQVDALVNYFNSAKEYGVTHFFAADDTVNEMDEKLEILKTAINELDWTPHISGFARLDMMYNKPYRIELLRDCGIHSLFFGIESMNYNANKYIRKGSSKEKIVDTLKLIKEIDPNFFLFASFIVGLEGDSEDELWRNNDIACEYLDSLNYIPLFIQKFDPEWEWMSDIEKNPEQYGYKVTGIHPNNVYLTTWKNSWINNEQAEKLASRLNRFNIDKYGTSKTISNWMYTCAHALEIVKSPADWPEKFLSYYGTSYKDLRKASNPIRKVINTYIEDKLRLYK